jgi:hypothetical protein
MMWLGGEPACLPLLTIALLWGQSGVAASAAFVTFTRAQGTAWNTTIQVCSIRSA